MHLVSMRMFSKNNIFYSLMRNISFSENFDRILDVWSLYSDAVVPVPTIQQHFSSYCSWQTDSLCHGAITIRITIWYQTDISSFLNIKVKWLITIFANKIITHYVFSLSVCMLIYFNPVNLLLSLTESTEIKERIEKKLT